jgi:carbon-monoxide dehydrogenase medium subunit
VKAAPFVYHAPRDVDAATAVLAEHGEEAKVLAGGQSLVPMMALRLATPAHVVDIGRIESLGATTVDDDGIRVGANVSQRALERLSGLRRRSPLLADALPLIAHPPIRNRGTVCGSLAHADPAAELPAAMLALDATFVARSARGARRIAADDFFVSFLETALEPDELLSDVHVPPTPTGAGSAFAELSRRNGDFALAGIAVHLVAGDDGTIVDARVAACGLASTPIRLRAGEDALTGRSIAELRGGDLDEVAALATAGLDPPSDVHAPSSYRTHVARVLLRAALDTAIGRCEVPG